MTSRPTHFLDVDRSGTGPLCEAGDGAIDSDPTTVLVERVTCKNCRDAINHRLAIVRINAELEHQIDRRKGGRRNIA